MMGKGTKISPCYQQNVNDFQLLLLKAKHESTEVTEHSGVLSFGNMENLKSEFHSSSEMASVSNNTIGKKVMVILVRKKRKEINKNFSKHVFGEIYISYGFQIL